jgi:hypothetical protein
MPRRLENLRERVANAITYHPGNRTGTPDQRHPVSLMLADAVLRVVRPCTCDADPIECSHEAARGHAEERVARVRALHRNEYGSCSECTDVRAVPYPCPTIQALDDAGTVPEETAPAQPREDAQPS